MKYSMEETIQKFGEMSINNHYAMVKTMLDLAIEHGDTDAFQAMRRKFFQALTCGLVAYSFREKILEMDSVTTAHLLQFLNPHASDDDADTDAIVFAQSFVSGVKSEGCYLPKPNIWNK